MIGLTNLPESIGDGLMWSSLPENFYKSHGQKLVDIDNKWFFDYNMFVERNKPNDITEKWECNKRLGEYGSKTPFPKHSSITESITACFGCKTFQRKPRLYQFEDVIQEPKSICLHTTGKSIKGSLSFETCEVIAKNYPHHKIIQVGGAYDSKNGFLFQHYEDRTNLPIWDTAKIIASSEIFIGVNSGMLHIANCFDRVIKKVILFELTPEELEIARPGINSEARNAVWLDYGWQYYNALDFDIGITRSIKYI